MGPLYYENTVRGELDRGAFFGITGSTDHHNAHRGSYGYGRIAVLAETLSRDALWNAMQDRKIYAVTGDKIWLETTFDSHLMGSILSSTSSREMEIDIKAGYTLDTVHIIKNGLTAEIFNFPEIARIWGEQQRKKGKVIIEVGWGEKGVAQNWDFTLEVIDGDLIDIEPRLHGIDIVAPLDDYVSECQFTDWDRNGINRLSCRTITWCNPTTPTSSVQGFCLEISGTRQTSIKMTMGTWTRSYSLEQLIRGDHTDYLADFLSAAVKFGRFIPEQEYTAKLRWKDEGTVNERDDYYIRVIQKNNQRAWSSPIRILR